jgi:hypothetical protein
LRLAGKGGINVHGGLLPQYRGANPTQWAIIRGEQQTGVTMHILADEIDAGPIIAQRLVPILLQDTWCDVHARIAEATEGLLAEQLPSVLAEKSSAVPQEEARAHTFPRRKPEDGRIDMADRVIDIYNLIRALVHPHPGAFYDTDRGRVVLDRYRTIAEVVALKYSAGRAGALQRAGFSLAPVIRPGSEAMAQNATLLFDLLEAPHSRIAQARMEIDWPSGCARVALSATACSTTNCSPEWRPPVERFAREELGLQHIQFFEGPSPAAVLA